MRILLLVLLASSFALGAAPAREKLVGAGELEKQEQKPLFAGGVDAGTVTREIRQPAWGMILGIVVFLVASAGIFFALKFLQRRGGGLGSRRYLIESLSYCPVGPGGKAGLSLVKIGNEFVLVGVTAQQVTFLSSLPELKARYESEAKFERGTFTQAVQEELARAAKRPEGTA